MIRDKNQLSYYLECDCIALGMTRTNSKLIGDEIWKFERGMRKLQNTFRG